MGTGEGPGERKGPAMDTPSLRGIASTAPYLHDGRAASLRQVLTRANRGDRHGRTAQLSQGELGDLESFLRALPFEDTACGAGALCLLAGRLRLDVRWRDARTGGGGAGRPMLFSQTAGAFWFFAPDNLEVAVKLVDGSPVNGSWWLFLGALTDLEAEVRVTDTVTGVSHLYRKAAGTLCGAVDLGAFDLPPQPARKVSRPPASPAGPAAEVLSLVGGRYQARLSWRNPRHGRRGSAFASPMTGRTGAFWIGSPANPEAFVKILDGTSADGSAWLFFGTLTDLDLRLTVTDTESGAVETYHRPARQLCGFADTRAFERP